MRRGWFPWRQTLGAAVALAPLAVPLPAQRAADSARLVRAAHRAQRDYEWTRRTHLPWIAGGGSGHCDERIGRFCYWHGETVEHAPPDPPVIARARRDLLAVLDSAGRVAPADGWVAGQRVRYDLEAGSPDSALAALTPCGAEAWWCDALRGLALHVSGRFAAASSAFDAALAEMPERTRCRWLDLTPLLDDAAARRSEHTGCDGRAALDSRLWWLAQPFYSMDANDRRTEHFARRTMIRIASTSVWPEVSSWADDIEELILRYGWPRWFERVRPAVEADPNYSIMGHDPQPSFAFFPNGRLLDSAFAATPGDWDLRADRARSRYAPAYAISIDTLAVALSRFVRGDSAVLVAAYDASRDTTLKSPVVRAAIVAMPDERQRFMRVDSAARRAGALAVVIPRRPTIVSVELFDDSARAAARLRTAVAPLADTGALRLSDMLMFRPAGDSLPQSLPAAAALAVARVAAAARLPLGLFWEVYGPPGEAMPLDVSLTVERTGARWWERARWALHLGGRDAPISLRWRDVARFNAGVSARAVAVDLSRLDAGTYRIRLEVRGPAQDLARTEKTVEVRR